MNSDKNVLLVGINAKYIHSNLAVRYLQKYAAQRGYTCTIREFTINQQRDLILSEIYSHKPDVLGFSCYIWNIELIEQLIADIKKVLPEVVVILGGPEITGESNGAYNADYIITGAGEEAFLKLVSALENGTNAPEPQNNFEFSDTVFPYDESDFIELADRIIYYETQRGCPFKCTYCLSSQGDGVSFLPIERVFHELSIFLLKKVKQVKLVDRTFNCNKAFRRSIWNYLIENDNGKTNFHFEITAELLEDEDFEILKQARASLFQFEIGVQTTCEKALAVIDRKADFDRISKNVKRLAEGGNIHLHLDLIAGLPYEDFDSFKKSFNNVFSLEPDMLQLGFLKLLKGSKIRENAHKYGIAYSSSAPYEVLQTNALTYAELLDLKKIEHLLESYYNSGLALHAIKFMHSFFETPFDFFYNFAVFWDKKGYGLIQHSKMKMYERLLDFFEATADEKSISIAKEALVFDIIINDNIKTLPDCLTKPTTAEQEQFIADLLSNPDKIAQIDARLLAFDKKKLRKQCNMAFLDYAVYGDFEMKEAFVFFHYLSDKGRGTACVMDWRQQ